jgi:uncharacterized repeat protein (TIGR03943 family)
VTKSSQNFLMLLIAAATLWITLVSGEFVNYVKPWLRYPLIGSAILLIILAGAGLRKDWSAKHQDDHDHADHGHGHDHSRGSKVAWLLCLPILAIFAVAPPALGSFTASRTNSRNVTPPKTADDSLPPGTGPLPMAIGEFMGRTFETETGGKATLAGRKLDLLGFAQPRKGSGWYLTRIQISCCAADAIALQIVIRGAPAPAKGTWVHVIGTWKPVPIGKDKQPSYELNATSVTPTTKPIPSYE